MSEHPLLGWSVASRLAACRSVLVTQQCGEITWRFSPLLNFEKELVKALREVTSMQKFLAVLTVMLFATTTADAGVPTSLDPKDYDQRFQVFSEQMNGCSMGLFSDTRSYVVHDRALTHCTLFHPGEVLLGRIAPSYKGWPPFIQILATDEKGKPHVYGYSIAVESVR
jgi:hypothetical protein